MRLRRADDAARNLAAIGDQQRREHQLAYSAHFGLRFSRKAESPSFASSLARRSAMRRAVSAMHMTVDRPAGDRRDQLLGGMNGTGRAGEYLLHQPLGLLRQRVVVFDDDVHEAERLRRRRVEALGRQEIAMRRARADRADHIRRNHRRNDAEPHLRQARTTPSWSRPRYRKPRQSRTRPPSPHRAPARSSPAAACASRRSISAMPPASSRLSLLV